MNEIKTMSSGDTAENVSSATDFEQDFRRTIRNGNKIQICCAILRDFFTESSVQGFKYFCERKRHWSERVFWMIMFVIATYSSSVMIHDLYIKWDSTPVIISLSEKATPVWKVPFPAVTICPEVKISSKMLNLTQTFHELEHNNYSFENFSEEKINHLIALIQICNSKTFDRIGVGKNFTDAVLIRELNHISIELKDLMTGCEWRRQSPNCSDIFRPILTEEGFCFTFNSLNSRDIYKEEVDPELLSVTGHPNSTLWDLEEGYSDSGDVMSSYPRRIFGTGTENGLLVRLFIDPDDLDYMCEGPVQGFKVVLHAPAEIPLPSKNYFRVPLEEEVLVSVKPIVLETLTELHKYPPSRKLCIMDSENPLKFFKAYTQRHCELECTSNAMKKDCGCVLFSYPRDKDTPICGVKKLNCVTDIEEKIDTNNQACNCLPSCTSLDYDVTISTAKFDTAKYYRAFNSLERTAFGRLNIYFTEKQFFASKRAELYAECGGILGLFIGVTALSFVEIFYYFTLRLAWTLQMYRFRNNEELPNVASSIIESS